MLKAAPKIVNGFAVGNGVQGQSGRVMITLSLISAVEPALMLA